MKRKLFIVSSILALLSPVALAGHVTYQSMYSSQDIIQGLGQTIEEAKSDAISAKPINYVLDSENSWALREIRPGEWLATRPIILSPVDYPSRRETIVK